MSILTVHPTGLCAHSCYRMPSACSGNERKVGSSCFWFVSLSGACGCVVMAGVGAAAAAKERPAPAACGGGPHRPECPFRARQQGSV